MDHRYYCTLFIGIVALSLIGAPMTMADWSEQASFSAQSIEESQVHDETPILQYENLSTSAQNAVRQTIKSSDGYHTIYGSEDWPDQFFYSDYTAPGQGIYAIVYEGEYYRISTYAGGGLPFIYWLYELPFIVYGFLLGWAALGVYQGERSIHGAVLVTSLGILFHILGPEFDFPLLTPVQFVGLGIMAAVVVLLGLVWEIVQYNHNLASN